MEAPAPAHAPGFRPVSPPHVTRLMGTLVGYRNATRYNSPSPIRPRHPRPNRTASRLERDPSVEPELVASRTCGECNVCCIALAIEDPELRKLEGHRCRHAQRDNSCGIYATRPHTCRTFYCGWRRLKWIRETLRPDKSGVLVRLHIEVSHETGEKHLGVIFSLLNAASLKAEGLAESIAAGVGADVPVYLHFPGRPGHSGAQVRINEALHDAVLTRNKPAVLKTLRQVRNMARSMPPELTTLPFGAQTTPGQPPNA
jgi:hypothetical protein